MKGRPSINSKDLGHARVSSPNRVANPPAIITACKFVLYISFQIAATRHIRISRNLFRVKGQVSGMLLVEAPRNDERKSADNDIFGALAYPTGRR